MRKFFLITVVISLFLVSCMKDAGSNFTPQIACSVIYRNGTDSMAVSDINGKYVLDSMSVGDSISFQVVFDAIGNNLTLAQVSSSDSAVLKLKYKNISSLDTAFSSADTLAGVFRFVEGYRMIGFTVEGKARKAQTASVHFRVESDSEYSPAELDLLCPIKDTVKVN